MTRWGAELRRFLVERVYRHYRVHRMGIKARRVVSELFHSLETEPGQLPPGRGASPSAPQRLSNRPVRPARPGAGPPFLSIPRAVCDYLASLSDREALNEHARLFDPFVSP